MRNNPILFVTMRCMPNRGCHAAIEGKFTHFTTGLSSEHSGSWVVITSYYAINGTSKISRNPIYYHEISSFHVAELDKTYSLYKRE